SRPRLHEVVLDGDASVDLPEKRFDRLRSERPTGISDDDLRGGEEVLESGSFSKELRVVKKVGRSLLSHLPLEEGRHHRFHRPRWNGASDHNREPFGGLRPVPADLSGHALEGRSVYFPIGP